MQGLSQLLPADADKRQNFPTLALTKRTWYTVVAERYVVEWSPLFTAWWLCKTVCATSNSRDYLTKLLHSPHVTVSCGFTAYFIMGNFIFEERWTDPACKPVQSLQNRMRNGCCVTTLCLHFRKHMSYLSSPSFRMVPPPPILHAKSRRSY